MTKKPNLADLSVRNSDGKSRRLAAIEGHKWKKGVSPNPGGRPKKFITLVSEAYRERLETISPTDPEGRTYAQCLAEAQIKAAISGDTRAAKEITDRTEGQARQFIETKNSDEFSGWTREQKMEYARTGKRPSIQ